MAIANKMTPTITTGINHDGGDSLLLLHPVTGHVFCTVRSRIHGGLVVGGSTRSCMCLVSMVMEVYSNSRRLDDSAWSDDDVFLHEEHGHASPSSSVASHVKLSMGFT